MLTMNKMSYTGNLARHLCVVINNISHKRYLINSPLIMYQHRIIAELATSAVGVSHNMTFTNEAFQLYCVRIHCILLCSNCNAEYLAVL